MTKYEYKRLSQIDIQGVHLERLGSEGWRLMHVTPRPAGGGLDEYLFMRESEAADELSLFDRVFGKNWRKL